MTKQDTMAHQWFLSLGRALSTVGDPELEAAAERVSADFPRDCELFEKHREVFTRPFNCRKAGPTGELLEEAFEGWRAAGGPSLPALLLIGAELLDIPTDLPAFKAALLAGLAGETGHDNPFHDRNHFREVLAMGIRLCMTHNQMARSADEKLSPAAMAEILLVTTGHDLGHDGSPGNTVNGVLVPYRLEQKAIDILRPLMTAAGMTVEEMERTELLLRVTDITTHACGKSPRQYLRDAMAYLKGEAGLSSVFPVELQLLLHSPQAVLQASIVSDSDLGPSISTYGYCLSNSARLAHEKPEVTATPGCVLYFLKEQIGGFLSPAGRAMCEESFRRVEETATQLLAQAGIKRPGGPKGP